MKRSNTTTSIATTAASNGTASSNAAPHRKNAAQRNRSDSPYQGRTAQKDNPTQLIIKQAVDFLIQQVEAGKSCASLDTHDGRLVAVRTNVICLVDREQSTRD
jgi:hypothetical protein